MPCADTRPTLANSAAVLSRTFLLIALPCIMISSSFSYGCSRFVRCSLRKLWRRAPVPITRTGKRRNPDVRANSGSSLSEWNHAGSARGGAPWPRALSEIATAVARSLHPKKMPNDAMREFDRSEEGLTRHANGVCRQLHFQKEIQPSSSGRSASRPHANSANVDEKKGMEMHCLNINHRAGSGGDGTPEHDRRMACACSHTGMTQC